MNKKIKQFRIGQGRTNKQYEDSVRIVGIGLLLLIGSLLVTSFIEIFNFIV